MTARVADPLRPGWPATGLAFGFEMPTRIRFGRGCRRELGPAAAAFGRRAALVTSRTMAEGPRADEITRLLRDAGVDVVTRIVASAEPDTTVVSSAVDAIEAAGADVVVAIGGGSAIDLAKAAALRPTPDRLAEYLRGARVETPTGLPLIALPTTAGSGSEVSHAAIVLDRAAARKRGIRGPGVAARVALVDPDLLDGLPPAVGASSGFDALAHAIETAASAAATPHVVALSGLAVALLLDALPRVVEPVVEPADRERTAYAALLMGLNLAASTTCLPHRLQYPLGARTGCGHAEGVAALMPAWLARTAAVAPDRLATIARSAGLATEDDASRVAAERLTDRVGQLLDRIGIRRTLRDFGVGPDDVDRLVAAVEGTLTNDPGPTSPADLRDLYVASL